jgi:predicted phosphodiesterase
VLNFPILADYAYLSLDGLSVFATHGHHHNTATPPPLRKGEILLHGHTHVLCATPFGDENWYINPGSAALPKEGNPRTYAVYESRAFTVKTLDGDEVLKKEF